MHLIAAPAGDPAVPATAAAWAAINQADLDVLWTAWTDDVLVNVSTAELLAAVPDLPSWHVGVANIPHLPLHIVEFFYGRLMYASDGHHALRHAIAPAALARAEAYVHRVDPGIFVPCDAAVFVQRLELFVRGLTLPIDPALIKLY